MREKKYNMLKAASWYTIGDIMIKGVAFFLLPVFTRLMNTHEYGVYSVYASYASIFMTILLFGLSGTITIARYAKEVAFESYFSTIVVIPVVLAAICMVGVNISLYHFGDILSMGATLWNCLLISSAAGAVCDIIGSRLIIEGRYQLHMSYSAISTIGNIAFSLLLCYTLFRTQNVHLSRVYGSTGAVIVAAVFLLWATKPQLSISRTNIRYALTWGIPLLFHIVATVVLVQSDRILIRYMDSYSSAGIYAIATTLVSIPMVLQQSMAKAWMPWLFARLDAKEYTQIQWLHNRYIVLYGVAIATFMLVAPDIIHFFVEESYWPSVYSLTPLAISVFAELLYSIPTNVEYYNKKSTYIMTATVITVVINIVLDVLFIWAFGYIGAAYATAISKMILFLMHYRFSRKLDQNSLFSGKVVIFSVTGLAALNAVILFTLDWFVVRYVILLGIMLPVTWYMLKNKELLIRKFREG